ncbi:hypothetical protein ACFL4D_01455 [Candidatus Margulisiibacteriota bacterium]
MTYTLLLFSFFFSPISISAQEPAEYLPINVEADSIEYSRDQRFLEASGNVSVEYEDYIITAHYLRIDMERQQAEFGGGFSFTRNQRAIIGEKLFYDLDNQKGQAEDVTIIMGKKKIKGETIRIEKDKVFIKNSTLTTCGLDHPHYKVTASDTTLYLDWGLLISGSGLFWLSDVPVMIVPNYVVGDPLYGKDSFKDTPLPRIGSDRINGTYVKESMNVYADERNTGTAALEWYEKNGWLMGFRHDWRYSRTSFGNIRLRLHTIEGLEGGITHRFLLTDPAKQEEPANIIEQFFNFVPFNYTPFLEAQFDLSSGEIYNDDRDHQRVSFLPLITLTIPKQPSMVPNIDHELIFQLGNILEERQPTKSQSVNRIHSLFGLDYSWSKPIFWDVRLGLRSGYTGRWYWHKGDLTNSWNVIDGEVSLSKQLYPFEAEWGYYHNFINVGDSAFLYDSKDALTDDEIRYMLGMDFWEHNLSTSWRYNLPGEYYRDIDVSLKLGLHCWSVILTWREVRQEFNVGVSLN